MTVTPLGNTLEDNVDTFAGLLLLVVGGLAIAVIVVGIVVVSVQDRRRARARQARARAVWKAQPPRITVTCDTTGCGRVAWIPVTRRTDGTSARVCPGCYDTGRAWGWWVA